jgi:hypothetical protein
MAMALFLTLFDRFKNHIFYEHKRMKKLALFFDGRKKNNIDIGLKDQKEIKKFLNVFLVYPYFFINFALLRLLNNILLHIISFNKISRYKFLQHYEQF